MPQNRCARPGPCAGRAPSRGHGKGRRLTNRFALGVLFVALYVLVSAAGEVYAAAYFQRADAFVALLLSFTVVCLTFNLLARHDTSKAGVGNRSLLVFAVLNVVTAISWIGLFIGLKYVEPAIVVAFMVALGPTATVWLNAVIRRQGVPPASDIVVSASIAMIASYMIWISASGNAGVEWGARSSFGIVLAIVAGLSLALTNVLVKLLFDRGFSGRQVLAHRFYGTIILLLGLVDYSSIVLEISQHWFAIAAVGVSTMIVPLLLIQQGIRYVEPFTVNMVLSTAPIITFLFQYFDSRIVPSSHTFLGNILITAVAVSNIYLQYRRSA
uniref:EamA family transporter n=1 Tax=Bradyrhizobium ottawaense TaxID=931866 RepID=A0A2U8P0V7_9BRAD|nr:EamA family transporter [Bradyrhizobium ottawaense]